MWWLLRITYFPEIKKAGEIPAFGVWRWRDAFRTLWWEKFNLLATFFLKYQA
jgi:hypothetical protein